MVKEKEEEGDNGETGRIEREKKSRKGMVDRWVKGRRANENTATG